VNVTVENLGPCKKLLRFDIAAEAVNAALDGVAKDFQKQASLPGFRPGKAPRDMVLQRYAKDIEDETKRKLMNDSYKQALKDHHITPVSHPDIEEIQFGRDQALQFAATLETEPEISLPDYRGLPAKRERRSVTDEDIDKAIGMLAERNSDFKPVEREAGENDIIVVNYTGTCDGQPLTTLAPTARGLTEQKNFWVEAKSDSFIPGFGMQLLGAKAGDKRTVNVDFPADFVTPQLSGKKGVYDVEVVEVREKHTPAIDDALATGYGAENLAALREGVRRDLQNELNTKQSRAIRGQVVGHLLGQVNAEMPELLVNIETRNIVYQIVNENKQRGIPEDAITAQKDAIFQASQKSARDRVKANFVFQRIADKEGISVTQQEVSGRIYAMAQQNQMAPDKFAKEIEKRGGGVGEIVNQILAEKVIDFLQQHAKIEDVDPAPEAKS
jgi:trigger factor